MHTAQWPNINVKILKGVKVIFKKNLGGCLNLKHYFHFSLIDTTCFKNIEDRKKCPIA